MNPASFSTGNPFITDIIHVMPVPEGAQRIEPRAEEPKKESKPGFNDLLRDSSDSKRTPNREDTVEVSNTKPRSASAEQESSNADQPEKVDQGAQSTDASEKPAKDGEENTETKQETDQATAGDSETQQTDTPGDAQVQAAANAAAAELQALEATKTQKSDAQTQQNTAQQVEAALVKEATETTKSAANDQAKAAAQTLAATLPSQGQAATGPAVQAEATAAVQPVVQQGDTTQNNSSDARGDTKSTATTASTTTTSSTNTNATTATAFTVPDQTGSESRLPINPTTGATQSVDASRQAQVQTTLANGDNDSLNTARLTRGLANAVQQRGGAVTLRLTPPEMGTVRIQMQITGTNVSASFHAESTSAQTLLTTQLAQLRSALESKGMSVERLSVQPLASTTASNNTNQSQSQSDTQQQNQAQQQSAGDGRSRGQYSGDSSRQQSADQQQENGFAQQSRRGFFDRLSDAAEDQAA